VIAVDSSSLSALFRGDDGPDVDLLDQALERGIVVLPPVVLTEMLSYPALEPEVADLVRDLSVLETHRGFWERAARLRAGILVPGLRARLADTLISQSCLDHEVPLITRDRDFRHFADHSGLVLL
jgi:hypothetical protein